VVQRSGSCAAARSSRRRCASVQAASSCSNDRNIRASSCGWSASSTRCGTPRPRSSAWRAWSCAPTTAARSGRVASARSVGGATGAREDATARRSNDASRPTPCSVAPFSAATTAAAASARSAGSPGSLAKRPITPRCPRAGAGRSRSQGTAGATTRTTAPGATARTSAASSSAGTITTTAWCRTSWSRARTWSSIVAAPGCSRRSSASAARVASLAGRWARSSTRASSGRVRRTCSASAVDVATTTSTVGCSSNHRSTVAGVSTIVTPSASSSVVDALPSCGSAHSKVTLPSVVSASMRRSS
jgi:hypothetical protein